MIVRLALLSISRFVGLPLIMLLTSSSFPIHIPTPDLLWLIKIDLDQLKTMLPLNGDASTPKSKMIGFPDLLEVIQLW